MALSHLPVLRNLPWDDMRSLWRFALRRLNEEHLPQVAGSLTFTTVLALVPVLTIALAIFTTFPIFNTFRASLEAYFIQSVMPKGIANTILGNLNQFATKATRLSAFGAIGLIATTIIMMLTIDRAFNHIWRVKAVRPFVHRLVIYWAIMTLGPLFIGVSITVTTYLLTATSGVLTKASVIGTIVYTAISVLLTMLAFTLLYILVPNRVVDWRDAACGGLLAAVAFEVAKRIFVVFVAKFPTYTVIYGALAALPLFLVWVYVSWLVALMGAVLAAALPIVKYERWRHVPAPGSSFIDAMAILKVLNEARVQAPHAAVNARTIRARTRLGFDESESLLQRMSDAGWVGRIQTDMPKRHRFGRSVSRDMEAWTLLANPDQLTVADIYRLFVFNAAGNATLAQQVENAMERGLNQSLSAHCAQDRE